MSQKQKILNWPKNGYVSNFKISKQGKEHSLWFGLCYLIIYIRWLCRGDINGGIYCRAGLAFTKSFIEVSVSTKIMLFSHQSNTNTRQLLGKYIDHQYKVKISCQWKWWKTAKMICNELQRVKLSNMVCNKTRQKISSRALDIIDLYQFTFWNGKLIITS